MFKLLFPEEYDYMSHLVDDVIRLEKENKTLKESASFFIHYETGGSDKDVECLS
jgi:hypothetical protein